MPKPPAYVLVAGTDRQADSPRRVEELYRSGVFALRRAWAEAHGTAWAVLSANHGFALPGVVSAPYTARLGDMSKVERERWAAQAVAGVKGQWPGPFVFLGPTPMADLLRSAGLVFEHRFANLPVGAMCAKLAEESEGASHCEGTDGVGVTATREGDGDRPARGLRPSGGTEPTGDLVLPESSDFPRTTTPPASSDLGLDVFSGPPGNVSPARLASAAGR